jgi:quercetin dioxygenase-like cupin family protein
LNSDRHREGKPNKGFAYTTAFELAGTGVQIARGRVEPGGTVATHDGPQQYILYVIGGNGTLGLVDRTGATISEIKYKPDDVIVFQPNTLHNWKNASAAPFDFLGVDLAPPRK